MANGCPSGPISVVRDLTETSGSPTVVNGLSCMSCHKHGVIRFTDTIRDGLAVTGDARLKVRTLFPEEQEMKRFLDRDENRFMTALEKAISSYLPAGTNLKEMKEPVGETARRYRSDLKIEEVAAELGFENPAELVDIIKQTRRLRELGLGALITGNAIKRSAWSTRVGNHSTFQLVVKELDLGEPMEMSDPKNITLTQRNLPPRTRQLTDNELPIDPAGEPAVADDPATGLPGDLPTEIPGAKLANSQLPIDPAGEPQVPNNPRTGLPGDLPNDFGFQRRGNPPRGRNLGLPPGVRPRNPRAPSPGYSPY